MHAATKIEDALNRGSGLAVGVNVQKNGAVEAHTVSVTPPPRRHCIQYLGQYLFQSIQGFMIMWRLLQLSYVPERRNTSRNTVWAVRRMCELT